MNGVLIVVYSFLQDARVLAYAIYGSVTTDGFSVCCEFRPIVFCCRRLGKARERLLEATGDYALPHGGQMDEITGVRKQTRVRDLQFKVRG